MGHRTIDVGIVDALIPKGQPPIVTHWAQLWAVFPMDPSPREFGTDNTAHGAIMKPFALLALQELSLASFMV